MGSARNFSIEVARAHLEPARCIVNGSSSLIGAYLKVIHDTCRNAIEHALKELLRSAGFSKRNLRKCGHALDELTRLLHKFEEDVLVGNKIYSRQPISRGILLENKNETSRITFGNFLEQLRDKVSRYPSDVRYGDSITTFPPGIWVQAAEKVIEWVEKHKGTIRRGRGAAPY